MRSVLLLSGVLMALGCLAAVQAVMPDGVKPQVKATFNVPGFHVNKDKSRSHSSGSGKFSVYGEVVMNVNGAGTKPFKNPVVRVVVAVEAANSILVMDRILVRPGIGWGKALSAMPIREYGMEMKRNWQVNESQYVKCLEEYAYFQKPFMGQSQKNVEYFDRQDMLKGGIQLPAGFGTDTKPPVILAVRLECWQNGGLAGSYDSLRPAKLNSIGFPVDWFVIGKHPQRFSYLNR